MLAPLAPCKPHATAMCTCMPGTWHHTAPCRAHASVHLQQFDARHSTQLRNTMPPGQPMPAPTPGAGPAAPASHPPSSPQSSTTPTTSRIAPPSPPTPPPAPPSPRPPDNQLVIRPPCDPSTCTYEDGSPACRGDCCLVSAECMAGTCAQVCRPACSTGHYSGWI